jgi:tetratricopeptide (TPR) repeat protein
MWYGYYLGAVGRHADNLVEVRRALDLDPLNLTANSGLGSVLFFLGRYDEAVEQEKRTLDLDPGFPMARSALARIHAGMGQYTLAAGEMEQAHDLLGLASVQAESGNREAAKRTLTRYLQSYPADLPLPQMYVAGVYAVLGDKEESFRRLERAYVEHDTQLLFLKSGRNLARLRPDPRYANLIRRLELTP